MSDQGDEKSGTEDGLSMHPLTPEQALGGFMRVDPEKVKEAEKREARNKKRRKKRAEDADE